MTFVESARCMAGQVAILLGWRPDEFWNATPAEIATTLAAYVPAQVGADRALLEHMMEQYPDSPNGGD
jgi:uncharacterized phage protein (TIGR02216 family)